MGKQPTVSPDPLVMAVRQAMRDIEPRPLPTEMKTDSYGRRGWACPLCGKYCPRHDRTGLYWQLRPQQAVDYAHYNMHFAQHHATPFWKEEHIIATVRNWIMQNADKIKL